MIDYHALAPEFILGITVLAVLVVDLLDVPKYWTAVVGLVGLFASFVPVMTLGFCESLEFCDAGARVMFDGAYVVDEFSLVLKGIFLGSAFIAILLSVGYLESDRFWQGEFYFLMLASVFGAVVMASSRDLVSLFVALELVTVPTFMMAGWRKGDERSNEAALKYFIIGVLSSAVLLFGMSIVYGTTGSLRFTGILDATRAAGFDQLSELFTAGVVLTLLGFSFKVSAVPFHFWTPDTYEGAPTPVTAYLSVVSKTAGFVGFLVLAYQAFFEFRSLWGPMLWVLAALSMTVGNLVALRQTNVVRLLGYSSIAQGGFILVPFGAAVFSGASVGQLEEAMFATVTYLAIYAAMNLGAFAVIIAIRNRLRTAEIAAWGGLFTYAPGLSALLSIFFMSLAGIPPFAGWYAKFVMFRSVMGVDSGWARTLAAIAVINSVIAFAYYAKVVVATMFSTVPDEVPVVELEGRPVLPSLRFALAVTAVLVIVLGILPGIVSTLGELTKSFVAAF